MKQLSAKRGALRNEHAIRGMRSDGGSGLHLSHMAIFLRCHSAPPPPVAQYEAWLAETKSADPRGRTTLTGRSLRRAIVMIRNGESVKEAGRAVGCGSLKNWLARLPPELAA